LENSVVTPRKLDSSGSLEPHPARTAIAWDRLVFSLRGGDRLSGVEDEATARGFHLLLTCTLTWILLIAAVVVPFFAARAAAGALICAVVAGATLVSLRFARTGRHRTASIIFLASTWCVVEVISAISGGMRSGLYSLLVLMIVNAAWLLGRSGALRMATATLLVAFGESVAEYSGHALPLYFSGTPISRWAVFAGILLFAVTPILGILGTLKRQVAALGESEERFRTIVDSVNDAIFVLEIGTGRILEVNQRACEMYGYSAEEMRELSMGALTSSRSPEDAMDNPARADAATPVIIEWQERRRDGSQFWVEMSTRRARISGFDRLVAVARDITERKTVEEAQARIDEQLRQAQKMESVGQLAAGVAHDFNNLLTVINGYAELLVDEHPADAADRNAAQQILEAGERAAELTSQLLAFSRKQPARLEVIDLNRLILDSRKMIEPMLGEGVNFTTALEPRLGGVLADRSQIHQVLLNLAANARDAMKGRGRFHIETAFSAAPEISGEASMTTAEEWIALTVSDDGSGMDAETLQHVFEPFFTTKRPGKGTGLGLSTVYGIVRQNSGWIQVESEPDHGSTFRIYLPLTKVQAAEAVQPSELPGKLTKPSTVLLVEDQPSVREYLCLVLSKYGYKIVSAGTPGEAISLLADASQAIHVVVSDVIMPGMSGPEMVRVMRCTQPELKVLFISGYPADMLSQQGVLIDGYDYLPKPVQGTDLCARLEALIQRR
jgi:PAS domain S-box-containing protein